MRMEQPSHLFTVSEANELLEHVRPLVEQLQRLQESVLRLSRRLDSHREKVSAGNGYPVQALERRIEELADEQRRLTTRFDAGLTDLEELGVVLKDLNQGLVDFYSMREDVIVFLCWQLGEPEVAFWHPLETGFASRQPV